MNKAEMIRCLEPFDDETEILVENRISNALHSILRFTYNPSDREKPAYLTLEIVTR